MRRAAAIVALALFVTGCGFAQPSLTTSQDLNDNKNCAPAKFLTGQLTDKLTFDTAEEGLRNVIWPSSFRFNWAPGIVGHWEVRNGTGTVVATSGGRFKIGGVEFEAAGHAFWACGPITPL